MNRAQIITGIAIGLALLALATMITCNAWLSDDAYITFRTVDNLLNGYGPTWNVAERVQVYTHPLWMLIVAAAVFLTGELFVTVQVLSILVSLAAASIIVLRIARSTGAALLAVTIMALSKAFVDYSTSGLENCLTHLLLVAFLALYLRREPDPRSLFAMGLLAALGATNRMDTSLLYLPPLVAAMARHRTWRGLVAVIAGFIPFVAWEAFALFYYGFPVPNTAFAKLNVGLITRAEMVRHGIHYLVNSLRWDPLTLVVAGLGGLSALTGPSRRGLAIAAGGVLYAAYLVWIGGDFMSGRFFSAPLLTGVALLADHPWQERSGVRLALAALVLTLGLAAPRSPVFMPGNVGIDPALGRPVDLHDIADERANYYASTGLLMALERPNLPDHAWAEEGRAARQAGPSVAIKGSVGFFGYFAGPQVYVIDLLGLGDPLLAQLPPNHATWAPGHLGRSVPAGYLETVTSGENQIHDPNLAAYYDRLTVLTRADLGAPGRLAEIWRFNTGAYNDLRDAYAYSRGTAFTQNLEVVNPTDRPYVYAYAWNNSAATAFLLDDASRYGATYHLRWVFTVDGAQLDAPHAIQVSEGNPLSDHETLNVGVYFSDSPELSTYAIYERRFWFRIDREEYLIVLPGAEWHNPHAPCGAWGLADITHILRDAPR